MRFLSRRFLLWIILLAALIRAWNLGSGAFWSDETYTMLTAVNPDPIKSLVSIENSPPLYYAFFMPLWASISTSEAWARIPSLLAGLGCVILAFRMARRISSTRAGIIAALLVACDAYLVTHSREARAYTIAAFFSFWAIVETIEVAETSSTRAWIRLGLALLAACYTHYVELIFGIASAGLLVIRRPEKRTFVGLAIITFCGIAAFLPWLRLMTAQMFKGNWYLPVWSGTAVGELPWKDGLYYIHRLLAWAFLYNTPPAIYRLLYYFLPVPILLTALFLARPLWSVSSIRSSACFASLLLVLIAILWGLGAIREPVYVQALFILLLVILAVSVSEGINRKGIFAFISIALIALLLLLDGAGIVEMYRNHFHLEDRLTREPWHRIMNVVKERETSCDAIVVMPGWGTPAAWYLSRPERKPFYLIWYDSPYFRRMAPFARVSPGEPEALAEMIRTKYRRILVIRSRPGFYPRESEFWSAMGGVEKIRDEIMVGEVRIGILETLPISDTFELR